MNPIIERKETRTKVSQYINVRIEPNMTGEFLYDVIFDFSSELTISVISHTRKSRKTELSNEDTIQLKEKYTIKSVNSPDEDFFNCAVEILKSKIKL